MDNSNGLKVGSDPTALLPAGGRQPVAMHSIQPCAVSPTIVLINGLSPHNTDVSQLLTSEFYLHFVLDESSELPVHLIKK